MNILNCTTAGLEPYLPSTSMPWTTDRLKHLFRRMGFGIPPMQIENYLNRAPTEVVEELITQAINLPPTEAPEWADWTASRYDDDQDLAVQQLIAWSVQWTKDMVQQGFREKLALFWHNHFVTQLDVYFCPSWQYQYHHLLQKYALGNFKTFVYEMGKTPAMLIYLNGVQNTRIEPNENYARELFELFTLGQDNGYTQQDITEAARALTGWNGFTEACAPIDYLPIAHDSGVKTIFGRTGNFDYDDLHDILFEERANEIATFVCTKLYRHFVSPTADEMIVEQLASTFLDHNFEIAPVLRQLFKSEHFFDDHIIGIQIKSPLELLLALFVEWGLTDLSDEIVLALLFTASDMGQRIFNPIDVAGWQENRSWIDSNTLTTRWQFSTNVVYHIYETQPQLFVELARYLSDDSTDPYYITQVMTDYLLPKGFANEIEYDRATQVFKSEIPENYFEDGSWSLDWDTAPGQVALLVHYLLRQPAFQLT